jgi:hypothetical protein
MGTIIVIKGGAETGKTTAIRAIYENLIETEGVEINDYYEDGGNFRATVTYNSKKIGIVSFGDPGSTHPDVIKNFIKEKYDIIICASHPSKQVERVLEVSNGYEVIFTSHYQLFKRDDISNGDFENRIASLNDIFASNIINLIDQL